MSDLENSRKHKLYPARLAYAALVCVCLFWGTTYLGIRIGIESVPPLYLIAIRYVISGGLLVLASRFFGWRLPKGKALWQTAMYGAICIGIGNGFLALSEQIIPSGLAALFYTTAPFWMVGFDAMLPQGKRPLLSTLGGMLVGLVGVAYLVFPATAGKHGDQNVLWGFVLIEISAAGWVLGSLLQKRVRTNSSPMLAGAIQQLAAGLVMFVPAFLLEQFPRNVTHRSELAIAYLVVFGSIVGFSCFIYAMLHLPVALVSIYTFVNPIVAIALGWLFFREPVGLRECLAMLIIFAGIGIIRRGEAKRAGKDVAPAPEEPGAFSETVIREIQ